MRKKTFLLIVLSLLLLMILAILFYNKESGGGYMCAGENRVYLYQNIPERLEPFTIVAVNFWKETGVNEYGETLNRMTVGLKVWTESDPDNWYSERLSVGDQMFYRGYRITLLDIGIDHQEVEPGGHVNVCIERIVDESETTSK